MSREPESGKSELPPEPSLGPACLVVVILALAVVCIVCAFGSWFMFSDQPAMAERGIQVQLIPWVQASSLSPEDKASIVRQLEDMTTLVRSRQLTTIQLSRLKNCLEDNPALLWGAVEEILRQGKDVGLTDTELEAAQRTAQRLLRMTAQRKLSRNDMEFALDKCIQRTADRTGIEVVDPLTGEHVREFSKRGQQLADAQKIPFDPYEKRPSQVLEAMLKEALSVK